MIALRYSHRASHVLIGCVSLVALSAAVSFAQVAPTRLKYKVECATCRVELTPVVTLGKRSDPAGIIEGHFGLDQDRQGRFLATGDNFQVLVYDRRGVFLKALGRRGQGPGEFNPPFAVQLIPRVGRGDSIFVFHLPKVTVFSPDLVHARTFRTTTINNLRSISALPDGAWLIAGESRTPTGIGRELHVMDANGVIRRSLGPEQPITETNRFITARIAYPSSNGALVHLGSATGTYAVETLSLAGDIRSFFEVTDVPFLPKGRMVTVTSRSGRTSQRRVGTGSLELWGVDSLGQLWINGFEPSETRDRKARLEIVDWRTGTIRSSQVIPGAYLLLPRGNLAYSWTVSEDDGFVSYTVYSYRFVER